MIKKFLTQCMALTIALICICSVMSVSVSAYYFPSDGKLSENAYFYDEAGRFSSAQDQQIAALVQYTADEIGFNFALYLGGQDRSDRSIETMANDGAREIFNRQTMSGAVFLYIDLDGYSNAYDYMHSEYDAFLYYSDDRFSDRALKLLKNMQKYFPSGGSTIYFEDIYNGLENYCTNLIHIKNSIGPEAGVYYRDDRTGQYITINSDGQITTQNTKPYKNWWIAALVGLGLAVLTYFIMKSVIKKRYEFKVSEEASSYTSQNQIRFTNQQDVFLNKTVTSVARSSGSGGGGGHSSSGGGSGSHR